MLRVPSCSGSSEFKKERYGRKAWACQMCTTKAVGDLKHRVGMVVTCQWEPSKLGGEIVEF